MKIEGNYVIRAPRALVFQLLIDPSVIQRVMPGCESLEAQEDGSYKVALKAGVGSIKGLFNGSIRLDQIREPEHYQMTVEGKGAPGFVKGVGALDLAEQDGETTINYTGDVSVGGTLAGVGQRLILSSAKMMAGQFFTAIEAEARAIEKAEETGQPHEPPKHGFIRTTFRQISK
ncbi:MAG: SRPBCC family protein [Blastocatellia bacterium]